MRLIKLNLEECIAINDYRRIDQDLTPIESIRALALELEFRWPDRYNSDYIKHRLYRANKKGIARLPYTLVPDIIQVLDVEYNDLVHHRPPNKKKVL